MNSQVSNVMHSLCLLVFLPRTFVHVAFQVSRRLCHCSSIVYSGSREGKRVFLTSTINSSDFCSSLRHCTLNLIDGRPTLSLYALSLVLTGASVIRQIYHRICNKHFWRPNKRGSADSLPVGLHFFLVFFPWRLNNS